MRKLAFILIAVSFAACGDDNNNTPNGGPGADTCTQGQLGARKCDGTKLLECNGVAFALLEDCATSGEICEGDVSLLVASCEVETVPGTEFQECTGSGQGNCADGLACGTSNVNLFSADYVEQCAGSCCVTDCSTNADICGADRYCEPGVIEYPEGDYNFLGQATCYPVQERSGICLFNNDGCDDPLECTTVVAPYDGIVPQCKLLCDGADVGTDPASCGDETCIQAPRFFGVEMQEDVKGEPVGCTNPGTTDNCTGADNYACMEVTMEDESVDNVCARRPGICGTVAPVAPNFADDAAVLPFINNDANLCHDLFTDQYCGAFTAVGTVGEPVTEIECAATNYMGRYQDPPQCNNSQDALSCFGLGECTTFDGSAYECAIPVNICIVFCTPADGLGADLDCGTGYSCVEPNVVAGFSGYAIQWGEPDSQGNVSAVFCDTAAGGTNNCNTDEGFACNTTDFGTSQVCAKVRNICVAD